MEDIENCDCNHPLNKHSRPAQCLSLISSIPDSSIFRCSKCKRFWMYSQDNGWDCLDIADVWSLGASQPEPDFQLNQDRSPLHA